MAKRGGKQPGAGRPKGSKTKLDINNYVSDKDFALVMLKAVELAKLGNEKMITFIGDHKLGKAPQALTGPSGGDLKIVFDSIFQNAITPKSETNSG